MDGLARVRERKGDNLGLGVHTAKVGPHVAIVALERHLRARVCARLADIADNPSVPGRRAGRRRRWRRRRRRRRRGNLRRRRSRCARWRRRWAWRCGWDARWCGWRCVHKVDRIRLGRAHPRVPARVVTNDAHGHVGGDREARGVALAVVVTMARSRRQLCAVKAREGIGRAGRSVTLGPLVTVRGVGAVVDDGVCGRDGRVRTRCRVDGDRHAPARDRLKVGHRIAKTVLGQRRRRYDCRQAGIAVDDHGG